MTFMQKDQVKITKSSHKMIISGNVISVETPQSFQCRGKVVLTITANIKHCMIDNICGSQCLNCSIDCLHPWLAGSVEMSASKSSPCHLL